MHTRRTSLFNLYPVEEFSFTPNGKIYILKNRSVSQRSDKYTLTLRVKGERNEKKRHFTFEELRKTFVYLRSDLKSSIQPKRTICQIYTCCTAEK